MKLFTYILLCLMSVSSHAETTNTSDFSGVYNCVGDDAHEGKYTGTVTMQLKPEHSKANYASYDFKLEVPEYGT